MRTALLLFSLMSAALLAACGGASSDSASRNNAPTPDARPANSATPDETLPKIVAFGDSLTAGYGLSPAESYPALLQKMIDADGFKYEVVNAGVSGDTSAGGGRRIDWWLAGGGARVVLM